MFRVSSSRVKRTSDATCLLVDYLILLVQKAVCLTPGLLLEPDVSSGDCIAERG